jgi:signal recognition particle receptor subunit beta
VVDSADTERLDEAKEELNGILNDDQMRDAHLLVFANKMDLPTARTTAQLAGDLGLDKLRGRQWYIQGSNAIKGDGLFEGMDWLVKTLNSTKKK